MSDSSTSSPFERTQSLGGAVDRLADEFESAWRNGQEPSLDGYLARAPQTAHGQLFRELLEIEIEYRTRRGQAIEAATYRDRFPNWADVTDQVFQRRAAAQGAAEPPPRPAPPRPAPAAPRADRELLLGILALQMGFVGRDDVLRVMADWTRDKSQSVMQRLNAGGLLSQSRIELLEALCHEHLKQHGDDPQQSLAALSSVTWARDGLGNLEDTELQASLVHLTVRPVGDSQATLAAPVVRPSGGVRYRIVRPHAAGGLGEVYVAQDTELNREVALKQIKLRYADNLDNRARFVREAEITGRLQHPSIVPVYGLGTYGDGRPFYAMRFIEGDSLRDAIERFHAEDASGVYPPGERVVQLRRLLQRFIDVCQAMAYAHSRHVLHRDLKPGNIMLGKYGETLIVDWGLAKELQQAEPAAAAAIDGAAGQRGSGDSLTVDQGSVIGTPQYMSPEQAAGRLDQLGPASDIYSLGATLYHLVAGVPPFTGNTVDEVLKKVREGTFSPPRNVRADVPKPLEAICLRAMALEPADRYATAALLAEDVECHLADEPVKAYRETLGERTQRWMRRHRKAVVTIGAALAMVAVVSVGAAWQIDVARRRESELRQLSEAMRQFDVASLEAPPTGPDRFDELRAMLVPIEQQSPHDAVARRGRLLDDFARHTQAILERERFQAAEQAEFAACLSALTQAVPGDDAAWQIRLDALREMAVARQDRWDPLFDVAAPLDAAPWREVFDPAVVRQADALRLERIAGLGNAYELVETELECPAENIEFQVTFDPTWSETSHLGLALNVVDGRRYEFLLVAPEFDHRDRSPRFLTRLRPMVDVINNPRQPMLDLLVLRDGQPLRRQPVSVGRGPLRLLARREGFQLQFTVNDTETISVADPFPLPPSVRGRFGVLWPRGALIESVRAARRKLLAGASALEQADRDYAAGRYADALTGYQRLTSPEAKYKASLCQQLLSRADEAIAGFAEIWQLSGEAPETRQWRALAGLRLLQRAVVAQTPTDSNRMLDELRGDFRVEEIMQLIPIEDRNLILQEIRREGQRFRLAFSRASDVPHLELAVALDDSLNENTQQRIFTRWRLADAYRMNDRIEDARRVVEDLLNSDSLQTEASAALRVALMRDLLSLDLDLSDDARAAERLAAWLPARLADAPAEHLALLIDRARLAMRADDSTRAEADLKQFFRDVDVSRVSHGEYSEASLLLGLIHEARGEQEQAIDVWRRGARRNWHEGYLDPTRFAQLSGVEMHQVGFSQSHDSIIASWTGEITLDEVQRLIDGYIGGAGLTGTAIRRLLPTTFPREWVRRLALENHRTPQGRRNSQQALLQTVPFEQATINAAVQTVWTGARLFAFDGRDIPEAYDQLLYKHCEYLVSAYNEGTFTNSDMELVMNWLRGRFSEESWRQRVVQVHPPDKWPSMAYVLARRYQRDLNKVAQARWLFEAIAAEPATPPELRSLVDEELARLSADPPEDNP